jgi:hypothetical protein
MLSFGNDSSLFCDFPEAMFNFLPLNQLNNILVAAFYPKNPAHPGPARRGFFVSHN